MNSILLQDGGRQGLRFNDGVLPYETRVYGPKGKSTGMCASKSGANIVFRISSLLAGLQLTETGEKDDGYVGNPCAVSLGTISQSIPVPAQHHQVQPTSAPT